jgi:tetratricopeptide (TPR) repeat protein
MYAMCVSPSSPEFEQAMDEIVEYGLALASGNSDPKLMLDYAIALWNVRDLQETVAVLDKVFPAATGLDAVDLANAYALRAICELQRGNPEQTLADISRSLDVLVRPHPLALRGLTYSILGNMEQAVDDVRQAVLMDPVDDEIRAWKGIVLVESGEYGEAIEDLTAAIESGARDKSASECHFARARARLKIGNPDGAEDDCNRCIELDYLEQAQWPFIVRSRAHNAHNVYLLRAKTREALGQYNLALGDCFFAASLAPGDSAVYELRARIYSAIGNGREAIRDLARAVYLQKRNGAQGSAELVQAVAGR